MTDADAVFPYIRVQGPPREMGAQHGEQCRDRVRHFLEMILADLCRGGATREQVLRRTRAFQPFFERYAPRLLEEVGGLAGGAGLSFEEALLLQIRGEIGGIAAEACTTFAISGAGTAEGQILIGQNSDMSPEQEEVGIVLHAIPDSGPRLLMWTFGGHLGYHGMNSAGVAHFANALGGGPGWQLALPHYPVKRRMLEQTTVAEVLAVLDTHPVCSSGNYVLTGGCGTIADAEVTPEGYALLGDAGQGFIVHTNHFLSARFRTAATDAASLPDSFPRYDRIAALVREAYGRITVETMRGILGDHHNHPRGICRHPADGDRTGKTVAALIAEPERGRFHVSRGNPCRNGYTTYEV
jgi:isopenicillin-N N-acyltransferase like protein